MDIKLDNFSIINYSSKDIEHIKFAKEMKEANEKDHFLYNCIDKIIEKSATSENLHIGYGYIISEEEKLIGFFRPARKINMDTLVIDLGVHPNYRHQGYGTKILVELTDYLLKFDNIKCIRGNIDVRNKYSLECAKKAGYIEVEEKYPRQFATYLKRK